MVGPDMKVGKVKTNEKYSIMVGLRLMATRFSLSRSESNFLNSPSCKLKPSNEIFCIAIIDGPLKIREKKKVKHLKLNINTKINLPVISIV